MSERTPIDKRVARMNAQGIAEILGSKVVAYYKDHAGEPWYPYRVPMHTDKFWFSVLVSDRTYQFTGEHKRGTGELAHFCITLNAPWKNMLATTRHPRLSEALGVAVYFAAHNPIATPEHLIACDQIRSTIRATDWATIDRVFLNASQILVWSSAINPAVSAEQVTAFRDTLLSVHQHYSSDTARYPPSAGE